MRNRFLTLLLVFTLGYVTQAGDLLPRPQSLRIVEGEAYAFTGLELIPPYPQILPQWLEMVGLPQGEIPLTLRQTPQPPQGYRLQIGPDGICIEYQEEIGLLYALRTLSQWLGEWVQPVEITDWPAFPMRGVIEGFYGPPWSHAERLRQLEAYGRAKMNLYVYAPKDDPYHRELWRDPYPPRELAQLAELVGRAQSQGVRFVFAISPGLSMRYSHEEDWLALVSKVEALRELGVREFALLLDDIDPRLTDPQDIRVYRGNYALAQIDLTNRLQEYLDQVEPGSRLIMVPTEYWEEGDSPYRKAFREGLDPRVIVYSTGFGVVAPTITTSQAQQIHDLWDADILYWDNYPVNDYRRTRLFMGPLVGRDHHLPGTIGFTSNPMNEGQASLIPIWTYADYLWNPQAYEPMDSWLRAIRVYTPTGAQALQRFAQLHMSSSLSSLEAPTLSSLIWSWKRGDAQALDLLKEEFQALTRLEAELLEAGLDLLVSEVRGYLRQASHYGRAGEVAIGLYQAQGPQEIWEGRWELSRALSRLGVGDVETGASALLAEFLNDALAWADQALGVQTYGIKHSLPVYRDYAARNAIDGNPETIFWASSHPTAEDWVLVDLGEVHQIQGVRLLMASLTGPVVRTDDYLRRGFVEGSEDGLAWERLFSLDGRPEIIWSGERSLRYLRLLPLGTSTHWLMIREFLPILPAPPLPQIATDLPFLQDTGLQPLIDGNLSTGLLTFVDPWPGEGLSITWEEPQPIQEIRVFTRPGLVWEGFDVYIQVAGEWVYYGEGTGSYTLLQAPASQVTGIRLLTTKEQAGRMGVDEVLWR